jgi:hypothetical protein
LGLNVGRARREAWPTRVTTVLLVALLSLTLARPAHAYVDPGSGALLLQILAAGVVGGLLTARRAIARAAQWALGKTGAAKPPQNEAPPTERKDG